MVNGARLIGPSLGGVLIAAVGEGLCFAIDAISYVAVIGTLLMMKLAPQVRDNARQTNVLTDLREGWSYVASSRTIRSILLLLALVSLVGMPYTVLMPVMAPHYVANGDAPSISLSITWRSEWSYRESEAHVANAALRRFGLNPAMPPRWPDYARAKTFGWRAIRKLGLVE